MWSATSIPGVYVGMPYEQQTQAPELTADDYRLGARLLRLGIAEYNGIDVRVLVAEMLDAAATRLAQELPY